MYEYHTDIENFSVFMRPPDRYALVISSGFEVRLRDRPNWFWRKMQWLLLGWRWETLP